MSRPRVTFNHKFRPAITVLLACLWLLDMALPATSTNSRAQDHLDEVTARVAGASLDCGFDMRGAEEQWHNHKMNSLRLARAGKSERGRVGGFALAQTGARVEDSGDVALITDDGTMVMPPNKFDLKNRGLIFTPEGAGYRVKRAKPAFETDIGFELAYYFGIGDTLGDANNGYRDMELSGQFPFFGEFYDKIFIGTNGYITFTRGDTSARPSAAALASEMPRISPLWSDLNANQTGGIYFKRLPDRYIITWKEIPQDKYKGSNTFQAVLYADGRIAFIYKKINARSSLIGISPGRSISEGRAIDLSKMSGDATEGAVYEAFSRKKRIDIPALTRAFYSAHGDDFDAIYIWTDFEFDNGIGYATSFNVRNDISGIGIKIFDRGGQYGSASRLSTIVNMGNIATDWPPDPDAHVVGLFSAIGIACHELGHRWLSYVRFDADHDIKDDLLGRDASHWSFFVDTRTDDEGKFSSVMEGNVWRDSSSNIFTSIQSSANYFSELDQYLMGLRAAEEVGNINYIFVEDATKAYIRSSSPATNFSIGGVRKQTNVAQIVEREGPRIPDAADAPKEFRVAFILLSEQGARPSDAIAETVDRYRRSLVRYFSAATGRRGSLNTSLQSQ